MKIYAGIAAYNEEKSIKFVINELKKYITNIIVVDDGSYDNTYNEIKKEDIIIIKHKRNLGKGAALRSIFNYLINKKCNVLVLLDADMQHNISDIPKLIKPILDKEADIVIGSRFLASSNLPVYRKIGLKLLVFFFKILTQIKVTDPLSGYRAISGKYLKLLTPTEKGYGIEIEMLIKAKRHGLRIAEIPSNIIYFSNIKTSKKFFIFQGLEIIGAIIKNAFKQY